MPCINNREIDPTRLAVLHLCTSWANNQYISLVETYPTLVFRVPKMIHILMIGATISWDWFVIWMGLLSFKIAAISDWFNLLAEKDIPQIWLNDFRRSSICNFSENCPRAGIILDWLNTDKNLKKPPIEWFTSHHIPVWYLWTQDHINACSRPQFAYLRPPREAIQMATTLSPIPPPSQSMQHLSSEQPAMVNTSQSTKVNMAPPAVMNASIHMSQKEFNATQKAYVRTKPWAPFFEVQAKKNKAQLECETVQQHETRLNCERNPLRVSVEVYEWDWSEEDPLVLVRTHTYTQKIPWRYSLRLWDFSMPLWFLQERLGCLSVVWFGWQKGWQ